MRKQFYGDPEDLMTDWETNPRLREHQRDKARHMEDTYLRSVYNEQVYNIEPNKTERTQKYLLYNNSCYKVIGVTTEGFEATRGKEKVIIPFGSKFRII